MAILLPDLIFDFFYPVFFLFIFGSYRILFVFRLLSGIFYLMLYVCDVLVHSGNLQGIQEGSEGF